MLSLAERVYRTILRYDLFPPGARTLVAVSGGADSTALAHVLRELEARVGFALIALAHVNHGLRGPASDADEAFCREMAGRLALPLEVQNVDARAEARRLRTSVEDAGRRLRYAFLGETAERLNASRVALGHTVDDQAETVLLALVRGAGPRGLGGIRARRGPFVRPLIEQTHEDVVGYLGGRNLDHREDESNRDARYLRNRVRHELLPLFRRRFSPGIVKTLARSAAIWDADAAFLDDLATRELAALAEPAETGLLIDRRGLVALPLALRRRVARLALSAVAGPARFVGFEDAERLLGLAADPVGSGSLALPGQRAEARGDRLLLDAAGAARANSASSSVNFLGLPLSIPGEVSFPGTRLVVSAERQPLAASPGPSADRSTATLDAATISGLVVRSRRPGDRFRPLGLRGRKKLQDFFVDRKVPRAERDRTPIVTESDGRIVWVAGHEIAEDFRVSAGTHDVVILKLRGERV